MTSSCSTRLWYLLHLFDHLIMTSNSFLNSIILIFGSLVFLTFKYTIFSLFYFAKWSFFKLYLNYMTFSESTQALTIRHMFWIFIYLHTLLRPDVSTLCALGIEYVRIRYVCCRSRMKYVFNYLSWNFWNRLWFCKED